MCQSGFPCSSRVPLGYFNASSDDFKRPLPLRLALFSCCHTVTGGGKRARADLAMHGAPTVEQRASIVAQRTTCEQSTIGLEHGLIFSAWHAYQSPRSARPFSNALQHSVIPQRRSPLRCERILSRVILSSSAVGQETGKTPERVSETQSEMRIYRAAPALPSRMATAMYMHTTANNPAGNYAV